MDAPPEMSLAGDLRAWVTGLCRLAPGDDAERIEMVRLLEKLKCAAAGAQARLSRDFEDSQLEAQRAAGVPARDLGKGIAAQVALARRESPHRGSRLLGLAHALDEMPHARLALARGEISEWRATVLARETACLSRADRAVVDAELQSRPGGLESMSDRDVERESRRIAYRLDPHAFTRRAAKAESERSVTVRPAPDTMAYLTGLLPAREGVAVYAALVKHADSLRSEGDVRTRGQIMADTLVERVTGQASASGVPVEVHLVMTDAALLAGDAQPAEMAGFGPVPAPTARTWLADAEGSVWLRRLYTSPGSGDLAAMDSTRRSFAGNLRRFIGIRDGLCRTPWCGAPIRHIDHARRAADGGETSVVNGQGLCQACNLTKDAVGWQARVAADGAVETLTPTGHRYVSRVPPSPAARGPSNRSRLEVFFRDFVLSA
ncbi:MAG: hypothetical protein QOF53_1838 [Nocardioidaceae bacterium]|nr:hypothetical protein [Nocardioidaceae bacterium]